MVIVSLATDGTDGPTDSAGALADATTVDRGKGIRTVAVAILWTMTVILTCERLVDLLLTGPTRTNVNDLIFVFVF